MKLEIPAKLLLRLLRDKPNTYRKNDRLYSLKTGKYYGTVYLVQRGNRGAEYVYIMKEHGKGVSKSATELKRLVRIERDDDDTPPVKPDMDKINDILKENNINIELEFK